MEKSYIWIGYFSRISKMISEDSSWCVVQMLALPSASSSWRKITGSELDVPIIVVIKCDVIPIIHVAHKVTVYDYIVELC